MLHSSQNNNINEVLPEETVCLILGRVDFRSKAAVLRTCKRWYRLLTYPPQGSGVWGKLPLNLMRLHVRVDSAQLEWLARRAAGFAGIEVYAATTDELAPRYGLNRQLADVAGGPDPGTDYLERGQAMPYRLTLARQFAGMTLARILGMLSPWLPPASVSVALCGATFEHRSFAILTSESQPWLTDALVDVRFKSNMVKVEDRFPQLCTFTHLTRLELSYDPGSYARTPSLQAVPPAIGHLTQLHTLSLELHADSVGLPAAASSLQALRSLKLSAGARFQPDVLATLTRLEDLRLYLGAEAPPSPPASIDAERLADAIAPLTRLTRLCLADCTLGAIPAEVMGMRRLVDLSVDCNQLWRCGGPPPAVPDPEPAPAGGAGAAAGHGPFPMLLPPFVAGLQHHAALAHAAALNPQGAQQPGEGAAAAAAAPAAGAAQPGGAAGAGPGGDAQGAHADADFPGEHIYQMLQDAHAAATNGARHMAQHKRATAHAAEAAAAGHGWWPPGLASALQGLTRLTLCTNDIKELPPELSQLTALRELHLSENMLGSGGRATRLPPLPQLQELNVAYNGYSVLPPGLLQMHALTCLRFTDVPQRKLPPLDALLQMPNLQQVSLFRDYRSMDTPANIIQAGAFEAKFVAMRQARAGAQPAPIRGPAASKPGPATLSTFMQLGAVEGLNHSDDPRGIPMYPDDFMHLPPGHPHHHPHMPHGFHPPDDGDDGSEDDLDELDEEEDEMQWAEDEGWAGPGVPDFWHPPPPPPL